jgi:hypothetical protein
MLVVRLRNVEHEDVVCRLFPYTFEGRASTWYFAQQPHTIPSWDNFETIFLEKFGDDKSPEVLVMELSNMKMNSKEKVKDFNQRFLTLKTKFLLNQCLQKILSSHIMLRPFLSPLQCGLRDPKRELSWNHSKRIS